MAWLISRDEWLSIYADIVSTLPYLSFHRDQEATDVLSNVILSTGRGIFADRLFDMIANRELPVVVGCGESVYREIDYLEKSFDRHALLVVAANGATRILLDRGMIPDLVVTDLDGDLEALVESSARGSPLVVHAHGDNIDKLGSVALFKGPIVGSTQVEPRPLVYNFGGFTDGDRALFVLYHAGYRRVALVGFDFGKPSECPGRASANPVVKLGKLTVARMMISFLEAKGMEVCNIGEWFGGPSG